MLPLHKDNARVTVTCHRVTPNSTPWIAHYKWREDRYVHMHVHSSALSPLSHPLFAFALLCQSLLFIVLPPDFTRMKPCQHCAINPHVIPKSTDLFVQVIVCQDHCLALCLLSPGATGCESCPQSCPVAALLTGFPLPSGTKLPHYPRGNVLKDFPVAAVHEQTFIALGCCLSCWCSQYVVLFFLSLSEVIYYFSFRI